MRLLPAFLLLVLTASPVRAQDWVFGQDRLALIVPAAAVLGWILVTGLLALISHLLRAPLQRAVSRAVPAEDGRFDARGRALHRLLGIHERIVLGWSLLTLRGAVVAGLALGVWMLSRIRSADATLDGIWLLGLAVGIAVAGLGLHLAAVSLPTVETRLPRFVDVEQEPRLYGFIDETCREAGLDLVFFVSLTPGTEVGFVPLPPGYRIPGVPIDLGLGVLSDLDQSALRCLLTAIAVSVEVTDPRRARTERALARLRSAMELFLTGEEHRRWSWKRTLMVVPYRLLAHLRDLSVFVEVTRIDLRVAALQGSQPTAWFLRRIHLRIDRIDRAFEMAREACLADPQPFPNVYHPAGRPRGREDLTEKVNAILDGPDLLPSHFQPIIHRTHWVLAGRHPAGSPAPEPAMDLLADGEARVEEALKSFDLMVEDLRRSRGGEPTPART